MVVPKVYAHITAHITLLAQVTAGSTINDYGISYPLPVGPAGHARHHGW
jgi:hypothetical protein